MKILLVNKFHYIKGGSETYYFELGKLLKKQGHEVIYFSMQDEKNLKEGSNEFFVKNVDFNSHQSPLELVKTGMKMLYSFEAKSKFEQLIIAEKPDIIHFNIFQSQLTSSIVDVAYKYGIPMVYTAHDLKSICPNYQMLNKKKLCEKCLDRHYYHCAKNKCMKNSYAKSLLAMFEAYIYKYNKCYNKIDVIITPSLFYKKKIAEANITKSKIIHIPNFLPINEIKENSIKKGNYFLYFGRLSHEKGIITLIKAYRMLDVEEKLYIVGTGPIQNIIEKYINKHNLSSKIFLLGFKTGEELNNIIRNSICVILPSEWYENGPYTIMEAMAMGKPVIVSNNGGLPELVNDGENGLIVNAGDIADLSQALFKMKVLDTEQYNTFCKNAKNRAISQFSSQKYVEKLIYIYQKLLKKRKNSHEVHN